MHLCVSKLTMIGSDNGLLPGRRQAIIWTNAGRNAARNAFENIIWKVAAILSWPQFVKGAQWIRPLNIFFYLSLVAIILV